MARTVITIARTLGAGGETLGQKLAEELGYRYVDNEIIEKAASQAGVAPEAMAAVEARQSLIERILNRMASGAIVSGAMVEPAEYSLNTTDAYQQMITGVVRETASQGNVIIVAHGAGVALAPSEDVLRVLVTAPAYVRSARLEKSEGIDSGKAKKRVAESDAARAQFFQRFFNLTQESEASYDLVISTQTVDLDTAAAAVATIARGRLALTP